MTLGGNVHLVGGYRDGIAIMNPPRGALTKAEALEFAAWIVALASTDESEFLTVLREVQNT